MKKKGAIVFGCIVIFIFWMAASYYPDWLWFNSLSYSSVFWPMTLGEMGFGTVIWLTFLGVVFLNLAIANRIGSKGAVPPSSKEGREIPSQRPLSGKTLNTLIIVLVLITSFLIAFKGAKQWPIVLSYFYQQPFDFNDPIFRRDVSFYVFSLPLYITVQNGLLLLFAFSGLLAAMWYIKDGALQILEETTQHAESPIGIPKISIAPNAKKHLYIFCGIILGMIAWGYYLKIFGILYSTQGPAFGASYTDVHIRMWAYKILIFLSIGWGVLFALESLKSRGKLLWIAGGVWFGAVLLLSIVLPTLIQKIVVKPNELTKEAPYIAHNITYTRKAYNLDKIKEVPFQVSDRLSREDLNRHEGTIQNIRIWDERPLLQTYRQIQSIRLYYDFNNVDVDRYIIDGRYRQVMLAAREMVVSHLPAQANTWVNRHLLYTHGYGLASSPVNEVTREGLPQLLIKDVPPDSVPGLEIQRPEIYFGEKTEDYVLVNTKAKEFDFPKGDKNVYASYQGMGGVPITGYFRRLLYAIEFRDPQIFFTNYLTPESKILYNRRLDRRVRTIAPFLDYDRDPYLVVTNGGLYWIVDAYTTSNMYPYSLRSYTQFRNKGVNYIRNSVKVVINAYNGDVSFYKMDEKDPILKTYAAIFPDLFKPLEKMPKDLKAHLRYPRDLFELQAGTYGGYHMEDVQVFYNQEDLWQIPDEIYGDSRQAMKPYYIIIKIPGEKREEFLLMLPFTPSKKDNMIGWLAARSDLPYYGNLLVYKLPKDKLVYGPMQIEARVDQQTEISRELSLWDQRGSRVIRGNMLVIPISDTFLYVEPVYLQAKQEKTSEPPGSTMQRAKRNIVNAKGEGGFQAAEKTSAAALPELKRVIAALGNHVVMDENLETALTRLIEGYTPGRMTPSAPIATDTSDIYQLSEEALKHYNRAKEYLRQENWAGYGQELEKLEKALTEMTRRVKKPQP